MGFWRIHSGQQTNNYRKEQAQSDTKYAINFYKSLSTENQKISGWNESTLLHTLTKNYNNVYFEIGRRDLLSGNKEMAKKNFITVLGCGPVSSKFKGLIGLIAIFFNLDLESIIKLTGRPVLK